MNDATETEIFRPFRYCINTSTIRRSNLSALDTLDIAAEAGYDGVEPWIRELDAFVDAGGSLEEYSEKAQGLGLQIVNVIAFIEWVVDDESARERGWQEAHRNMWMCRQIGCEHLAAPPFGAIDASGLDLGDVADRYRELLALGKNYGVKPILEFWWMSKKLKRLSEAAFVALECGHPDASILVDIFHMYRGGSPWDGLKMLSPEVLGLVHINDYPTSPPRETLSDSDRVFPGDGGAPLGKILKDLHEIGYQKFLSLELFNEEYAGMDPLVVAREGLSKMKLAVKRALAG